MTEPTRIEAEAWQGAMGEKWLAHLDRFEGMIAPIGEALIERADIRPGEAVLDIGCGAGATSLALAHRVGPLGLVTGVDIAPVLVDKARERASAAGLHHSRFLLGDAASIEGDPHSFDRLFSRFGVMFFADPHGAFRHLCGLLRPGGRLDFSCWAPARDNAWVLELMAVAARYVELPAPVPRAPGPFAFDEPEYIREILDHAGFTQIEINPWRGLQGVGGPGADPATAARFMMTALAVGDLIAEQPQAAQDQALADLEAVLHRHHGPEGVMLPGAAWLVTARR